jgi:hypothetical protein
MRAAAAVVVALSCQLAHANPPGMTESGPPGMTPVTPPVTTTGPAAATAKPLRSYRGQLLASDAIAVGLLLVAANTDDNDRGEGFAKLSVATYALGAPVIHLTKNRGGRAFASLTMRIAFPIIGGMLFDSLRPSPQCDDYYDYCDSGPSDEMVLGVIGGVLAASIVDAAYLGRGDAPKVEQAPGWAPTARATQGGFAVGVGAAF